MEKFNIMKYFFVILLILSVFMVSCGSTKASKCVKESDNILIRLGEYSNSEQIFRGWEINSKREIYTYSAKNSSEKVISNYVDELEVEDYCRLLDETKKLFLKNTVLNVPGEYLHFIEFEDVSQNMKLMAFWVPEHLNVGNKEFKNLFIKYLKLLPQKIELKNKMISKEKIE